MRVKVEGPVDFGQMNQILQDFFLRYPPGYRIQGLNIHLMMVDAMGTPMELLDCSGKVIDVLTYREKDFSTKKSEKPTPVRSGPCVVPFRKPPAKKPVPSAPIDPEPTAA